MSRQPLPPLSTTVDVPLARTLLRNPRTARRHRPPGVRLWQQGRQRLDAGVYATSTTSTMLGDPGTSTGTADVPTGDPASPNGLARADVERWLATPHFSYVGETDYDQSSKTKDRPPRLHRQ